MGAARLWTPGSGPVAYLGLAASGTSVANDTVVAMSWTSSLRNYNWTVPSLPATAITLPFTGMLEACLFDMDWGVPDPTGYRAIALDVNGTPQRFAAWPSIATTDDPGSRLAQSGIRIYQVTAGQTVGIKVRQKSGNTLTPAVVELLLNYKWIGNYG